MVQFLQTTLLVLAVTTSASCQYFDFLSALQPIIQYTTARPQYIDYTTKRQNTHNTNRGGQTRKENEKRKDTYSSNIQYPAEIIYEITTRRTTSNNRNPVGGIVYEQTTRKTTSNNRNPVGGIIYEQTTRRTTTSHSNRRNIPQSNDRNGVKNNARNNTNANIYFNEEINNSRNTKETSKIRQNQASRTDQIIYPDRKVNTVYNYETTKSYTTKSPFIFEDSYQSGNNYVTQNPYKPGVRPAVTNGAPITNRPVTQKPYAKPNEADDTSITPELIFGPNEDYMSNVEKKRYIELAERMCDKYKSLNIKQVEAIPLLPSPSSVKVNVSSCTPSNVPLVVGGKVVTIQEFPHMALLGWKKIHGSGYYWKCGGSLISNQFVLTAGHCAYQDRDNAVVQGPPRVVQLGSSYLNDHNAKVVKVTAVYRHPKYKQPKSYYDVAVLKLASPVTFSDSIKPACLGIPPEVGEPIIATGWGRTEFGGSQSNELRSVSIPVWDMDECYDVLGTSRKIPDGPSSESQICAGEKKGGKDTCQGDSGGPAQVQEGCIWRVTAITSLGRSCGAPHTPALYAIVPRAFVAAIAFDATENKQKDQRNTNNQNNQPNTSNFDNASNSQRNNQFNNNNNERPNNVNYNNDRNNFESSSYYNNNNERPNNVNYNNDRNNFESSSYYNQYNNNNNYNSANNQRTNYESSYNNQRNNYDYTTQRNYHVQNNNYNYPSRNDNYGVQSDQYYNGDSRVWW